MEAREKAGTPARGHCLFAVVDRLSARGIVIVGGGNPRKPGLGAAEK